MSVAASDFTVPSPAASRPGTYGEDAFPSLLEERNHSLAWLDTTTPSARSKDGPQPLSSRHATTRPSS
jgi:hypothetical protein